MNDPQTKASPVIVILSIGLIIVAGIAGYFGYRYNQSQETVSILSTQLENSEEQIAQLQPLANKARQLPVALRINKHALTQGYNLLAFNQSRTSLRFQFTVNGSRKFGMVIDGGKFWVLRGLASGDTVAVDSEGYDSKTVTIQ